MWTQFSANFSSPVTTVVFFLHGRGKGSSFIKGNLHPTLRLIWRVESFSCICCFSMNSTQKDSIVRDSRCVCGGGRGWHTFWFTSQGRPGLPATTRSQKIVVEWILPQGPKRNQLSSHLDLRVLASHKRMNLCSFKSPCVRWFLTEAPGSRPRLGWSNYVGPLCRLQL